ncbi:putative orfan [Tupanvirus soda lake]|uniref:Orfan n=2 Tax=Tupanvirus TaxID=2094720 RepID=A0AC62ADU6_9VIRU|nr:putative orfan [Tupanvirus soda lake]QKU35803.1 putative orfan [Tupanvirus soda lake]
MPRNKSKNFGKSNGTAQPRCGTKPKKTQPKRKASNEIVDIPIRSLLALSESKQAERMREIATSARLGRLFCTLLLDISSFLNLGSINSLMRTCRSFYFLMTSDLVLKNRVTRIMLWLDATPVENYGIHTICKGIAIAYDERNKRLAQYSDDDYDNDSDSDDNRDYPWDYSGDRYYPSQYRNL